MTAIYLSLGSNVDRHKNIVAGLDALIDLLGDLRISSVYESKSVGFDGSNFFNLVVGADTVLSIPTGASAMVQNSAHVLWISTF
jgi:2-amino-4-hydroxy-6-hydroxymethyldihydropteridine diphosphokinase